MKMSHSIHRASLLAALPFVAGMLVTQPSSATIGVIGKADLAGPWQIALSGFTGCGQSSILVTVMLDRTGVGTNAEVTLHGGCGDSVLTDQTFQVLTMGANGSGTANLSCGVGCGWNFNIQVSPDRSIFNLVDVDVANPDNYLSGIAVHK